MTASLRTEVFFQQLEAEHRLWLSGFDTRYLRNWEKHLQHKDHEEAALAEARVRQILASYDVSVEPNEDLDTSKPRPDFRCDASGRQFYVEVTCIPIAVATEKTGIPNGPHGFLPHRPLNNAIFSKCLEKVPQSRNLDAPALVAIGTFHSFAAMASFRRLILDSVLTGETKIGWEIDTQTGEQVDDPREITELRHAAFLDPTKENWLARRSISGLLFSGLTLAKQPFIGVLHPNPVRPFDPTILPQVEFGQLFVDPGCGRLRVDWPEK